MNENTVPLKEYKIMVSINDHLQDNRYVAETVREKNTEKSGRGEHNVRRKRQNNSSRASR
jgi:hypothetical protein